MQHIRGPDDTDTYGPFFFPLSSLEIVRSLIADKQVYSGGDQNLSKGVLIQLGDLVVCW